MLNIDVIRTDAKTVIKVCNSYDDMLETLKQIEGMSDSTLSGKPLSLQDLHYIRKLANITIARIESK